VIFDASVDGRSFRVEVRGKDGRYTVTLDGRALEVDHQETGNGFVSLILEGRSYELGLLRTGGSYTVAFPDDTLVVVIVGAARGAQGLPRRAAGGPARLTAPMPGKLVRVLVEPGQAVEAGQGLVVMEAMKMENELRAPRSGRVQQVLVREGQAVETGALLAVVE
jgi:biotin carboxyl carrier protein